ncbi:hypothetical protein HPB48_026970 [Haemaphysalis longicornis]|uniref:Uncharacterized protein n=1 Tax=Haemaphysalis longicornis TaxID=44386 RepID=A0A9J6HB16_HAELO|nr:hypothetical protein HPB48_026970 [Haemaphysalis longicornis]
MYAALNKSNDTGDIFEKLGDALNKHSDIDPLKVNTFWDCLSCASRKDRVCLSGHQPANKINKELIRGLVESKERLLPVFGTPIVRKSFPMKQAFKSFVQRLFESCIYRSPYTLKNPDGYYTPPGSIEQLLELREFFCYFVFF